MNLNIKQKYFVFRNESFSCMAYSCVRESVRVHKICMKCEHSCRNAYVVSQCVCND